MALTIMMCSSLSPGLLVGAEVQGSVSLLLVVWRSTNRDCSAHTQFARLSFECSAGASCIYVCQAASSMACRTLLHGVS